MAQQPDDDLLQSAAKLSESIVDALMANQACMNVMNYDSSSSVDTSSSTMERNRTLREKALSMYLTQTSLSQGTATTCASSQDMSNTTDVHSPISSLLNELRKILGHTSPRTFPAHEMTNVFHEYTTAEYEAYDKDAVAAINNSNMEQIRSWFTQGRSLQAANQFGESLLHIACRRGSLEVTKFLVVEASVSVWVRDQQGMMPIHLACRTNKPNYDLVDFLVEQDSDMLFVSDKRGCTPLDYTPKDTWPSWNKFFATKDLNKLQPKRLEFLVPTKTIPPINTGKSLPALMLHDIDNLLNEYNAQKKERKEARRRSTAREEQRLKQPDQPRRAIAMENESSVGTSSCVGGTRSNSLKDDLSMMILSKLNQSLSSSNSNQTADVLNLLEGLSAIDPMTLLETIRLKRTLEFEISHMERVEAHFYKKQDEKRELTESFKQNKIKLAEAEARAKQAMATEVAARKMLENAQNEVENAKNEWMAIHKECTTIEDSWKKANSELDSISNDLALQQEKIHQQMNPISAKCSPPAKSADEDATELGPTCDDVTVATKTSRRPSLPSRDVSRSRRSGLGSQVEI
jgi:ankyrin repeat protein